MTLTDSQLIGAMASVLTGFLMVLGWLLRRWVAKTDQLHRDVAALERQAAVRDERITHLVGALEVLRKTVQDQAASIGVLSGMVHKMWAILEAQGRVEARYSDGEISAVRRKP